MYDELIKKILTETITTGSAGVPGEDKVIAKSQNGLSGEERTVLRRLKRKSKTTFLDVPDVEDAEQEEDEIDDKFGGLTASEVIDALGGQEKFKTFGSEEELTDWIDDKTEELKRTMGLKKGDINRKRVMSLAVKLYKKG